MCKETPAAYGFAPVVSEIDVFGLVLLLLLVVVVVERQFTQFDDLSMMLLCLN